jgi:hypothetical protein
MTRYSVPSGHGYMQIPLDPADRKSLKSIQAYHMDESLNVDLEFEDESRLELIFGISFHASAKLLDRHDGNYELRKKLKPGRLP